MIRNLAIIIVIVLIKTSTCYADVLLTEINWMGSANSQFAEWVEFYNSSDQDVNMTGWKLYEAGGDTLVFTFTKTIPSKGYLLLERITTSSPDPVPGINDESGSFGGSGLSNSGEYLVLKDLSGGTIQNLNFSGGWPAGDTETKKTMQWDGTKWVTATATPKAGLSTISGGGEEIGAGVSVTTWVPEKFEPKIVLIVPKTIYADVFYEYEAKTYLNYGLAYNGVFLWNMGDGTVYKSQNPQTISHSYKYPGTYIVSFGYYNNPYEKKPTLFAKEKKVVGSSKVSIRVVSEKGFEISNNTDEDFDLSNWLIKLSDLSTLTLPNLSLVASKSSIVIPFSSFGISSYVGRATLMTPQWVEISSSQKDKLVTSYEASKSLYQSNIPSVLGASVAFDEEVVDIESKAKVSEETKTGQNKNYTKIIVFSVVLLAVTILFIFLEKRLEFEEEGQ